MKIADSIIDAGDRAMAFAAPDLSAGGALSIENCTVIGKVRN